MVKERYLEKYAIEDLREKMVFVGGPRQVGKTTFAQTLIAKHFKSPVYFNWDLRTDRQRILRGDWQSASDLLIFDEIHKYKKWKSLLKGFYDTQKMSHSFMVTGSARLDVYRRGSDSLQGRYHYLRLHPFSVAEIIGRTNLPEPFSDILETDPAPDNEITSGMEIFGGFPEPFLKQNARVLRRWHNEKIERLFREDVIELQQIRDLQSMKLLSDILPEKVGSLLSLNNLANDIQTSYTAVASWMNILETCYYHFRIYPFQGKRIRAIKKEPKMYLWDWSEVSNEATRFENFIGAHLLKFVHLLHDVEGYKADLFYLRDRDQREVDFLVAIGGKPWFAVEVKLHDQDISKNLGYFQERLNIPFAYQVIRTPGIRRQIKDICLLSAESFLSVLA